MRSLIIFLTFLKGSAATRSASDVSATLRMRVARISVQDDPFVSVGSFETDEGIDGDALHHYVGPGLLEELKESPRAKSTPWGQER